MDCKYIYVIDKEGNPLMPISKRNKTFRLINDRKARTVRKFPFTIQLQFTHSGKDVTFLTLGIDTGSKTVGFSVVGSNGNCYYLFEKYTKKKKMRNYTMKEMGQFAIRGELTERELMKVGFCNTCGRHFNKKDMKYTSYCCDECKKYKAGEAPLMDMFNTRRMSRNRSYGD